MEINEGVQKSTPASQEKKETKKIDVSIRLIMLFDGTMNNKTNIESRLSGSEEYQKTRSKKYKVFGERVGPGADSYENGFTNIVALDTFMEKQPAKGFDVTVKVYTEGAGTMNNQGDETLGYALGIAKAGVKNKCQKGIAEVITKILASKVSGKKLSPSDHKIKKLTIDVFGFSRGAATARYCIYKLIKDKSRPIKKRLSDQGFEVAEVELCFAGLFDTVSSHGLSFSDDVRDLELDAVAVAKKVVHLAAADEYRKNFSVTNIKSAGSNGIEYFMPGVHSDVGGSYHDMDSEAFVVNSGSPAVIKKDRKNLIAEGWYHEKELVYAEHEIYGDHGMLVNTSSTITADRQGIRNLYCNIPLKVMAKYAEENGISIKGKLKADADKAISSNADLQELDSNIDSYMVKKIEDYNQTAPLLKKIRNKHFHMSAKNELGLAPRFKNGKRWRLWFDG